MSGEFFQRVRMPWAGVFLVALCYGAGEALPVVVPRALGLPAGYPAFAPLGAIRGPVLVLAALMYGAYRFVRFHPVYVPGYRRWLLTTPWTATVPLPLGPVLPVLQDGLIVAGLAALAYWRTPVDPLAVPVAAMAGYGFFTLPVLADGKRHGELLALAWVFPLVFLAWGRMAAELGIAAACFAAVIYGVGRALARLPWLRLDKRPVVPAGWPFAQLAGDPGPKPLRAGAGVLAGLLVGWWSYVLTYVADDGTAQVARGVEVIAVVAAAGFAGARLLKYASGYDTPIGFWGRLQTGRWVVPGYDVIWVAPACAVAAGVAVMGGMRLVGASNAVTLAGSVAASLAAVIEVGPGLRAWRLTGHHRMRPGLPPGTYARL